MPDVQKLLSAIDGFEATAYGADGSKGDLAGARARAIDMYLGKNTDPAPEGRSQVISRDIYDTVEIIKPSLLRIFAGGDEVVEFEPIGPDDEQSADQETAYVNYQILQKNSWFQICNDWFTDALLTKNAYALGAWEKRREVEIDTYQGQSDDQIGLLMQEADLEVVNHKSEPDEAAAQQLGMQYQAQVEQYQMMAAQAQAMGQQVPPPPEPPQMPMLHDVKVRRNKATEQLRITVLPPERCKVSEKTPSFLLRDCDYFEYWENTTISELRSLGFEVDNDIADDAGSADTEEDNSRDQFSEGSNFTDNSDVIDPAMRRVRARMIWVRHDYDEDGLAEMQYCVRVGNKLLWHEQCSRIPVACIVPNPMPHRHPGLSTADVTEDIQMTKTAILRQGLDNLYQTNNSRTFVSDRINLDDLMVNRPGGIVRGKAGAEYGRDISPMQVPFVFPQAIQGLEYMDAVRENRTGTNRYFSGTDQNAINKTASGIAQLSSAAAQRVEMIARVFAAGMEDLFSVCHELILKHQRKADTVKLRGKWVTVDPTTWKKRSDLRISVGLGTGNREQLLAHLQGIIIQQQQVYPLRIASDQNIFNSMTELAKASGFSTPAKFFTDPTTLPPAPQPPPPLELALEQMKQQGTQQLEQIKQQGAYQGQMSEQQFEQWKTEFEAANEKWIEELQAQVTVQVEQMKLGTTKELELTKMVSGELVKKAELDQDMEKTHIQRQDAASSKENDKKANDSMATNVKQMQEGLNKLAKQIDGKRPVGVKKIRDAEGKMIAARIKRGDGTEDEVRVNG